MLPTIRAFQATLCLLLISNLAFAAPEIISFTATPESISPGEPVELSWEVNGADEITIDGLVVEGNTTTVTPLTTQEFILLATDADGTSSRRTTVTVVNVPDFRPSMGRFVEVVKHSETQLHLSEIEVFSAGVQPNEAHFDDTSSNDLVQRTDPVVVTPPTTSELVHGNPASVFDGNIERSTGIWTTRSGLGEQPRYMLDLTATHPIGTVRVWGRGDLCCADRLSDFSVNIYADDGSGNPGELVNSVRFPEIAPRASEGAAELDLLIHDPAVESFTVDKSAIPADEPIVLSWKVNSQATKVTLDQGIGDVTHLTDENTGEGSYSISPGPSEDTIYSLLVTRPTGNTLATLKVDVTDEPVIFSFEADNQQVPAGTPIALTWGVSNAETLTLNGQDVTGFGGINITPFRSTNYVLTARNDKGEHQVTLTVRIVTPGAPIISEFMADNGGEVTVDEDRDSSDWIELCNPNPESANLAGYYLTDNPNNLTKWEIPAATISPGGYLLIFASGKDRRDPTKRMHTNFSLNDAGEYLALVKPDGRSVVVDFHPEFPRQRREVSYGFATNNIDEGFFLSPTPGRRNGPSFAGFVGDTQFSVDRGFFDESFELEITASDPEAEIRYTINRSKPTATSGLIYDGPIQIGRTTVVRAAAFRKGYVPTNVDTQTYLFTTDIIRQPSMSTTITRHPTYGRQMPQALKSIPSISLVFQGDVARTEKETSVEFINFEDGQTQLDAGLVRFGSYHTDFPKRSMRLTFRSEYGPTKLRFPIFDGHDYNIEPANEVDAVDLRAGNHDMNARGAYMSNRFTDDSMDAMGNIAPHGRFVHLYLNGSYWGQYHLRERWNAAMLAEYFPGKEEDYEAINANNNGSNFQDGIPFDGSGAQWSQTRNLVAGIRPFERSGGHIDIANVIDFMLLWVSGNSESEFRSAGSPNMGVPFKFFMKDADGFLRSPGHSVSHEGPIRAMSRFRSENHPDYKMLLADRIHKHFFNDGALTPSKNIARLRARTNEIRTAFYAEAARWGYRNPSDWNSYQNNLISSHFPSLTQSRINAFRSAGMYPNVVAPTFGQHGGTVAAGQRIAVTAPTGIIYYTTDGSDPRIPRSGLVSPTAQRYTRTLVMNETTLLKARVLIGRNWSALNEATFAVDSSGLVVSEMMYDPLPPTEAERAAGHTNGESFEYFELLNTGDTPIDLNGIVLNEGIHFDFSTGTITTLDPGQRLVVVEDKDAFEFRYGSGHPVTGQYTGKLDDSGEFVRISNALDASLIEFTYDNKAPWPLNAAGAGSSLVLLDPDSKPNHNNAASWTASNVIGGTPGTEELLSFNFADWAAAEGVTDPDADEDGDGLTNYEEFVRGSSPLIADGSSLASTRTEFLQVGDTMDAYLTITFTYSLTTENTDVEVQTSSGLDDWGGGSSVEHVRTIYHGDGTATATWRTATPISEAEEQFLRVLFTSP